MFAFFMLFLTFFGLGIIDYFLHDVIGKLAKNIREGSGNEVERYVHKRLVWLFRTTTVVYVLVAFAMLNLKVC